MIVRRAEPADLPDIIAMARRFHGESPVFRDLPFSAADVHELVSQAMEQESWLAIVAYASGGELAGMGLFFCMKTYFGPALECGDLAFYVDPDRRGGFAAAGLMKTYLDWAKGFGPGTHVNIGANTGINEVAAGRFFERVGFNRKGSLFAFTV